MQRVGIFATDPLGALRLTARGEAWLQLPVNEVVRGATTPVHLPELDPLPVPPDVGTPNRPSARRVVAHSVSGALARAPRPKMPTLVRRAASAAGALALLAVLVDAGLSVVSYTHQSPLAVPPPASALAPVAVPTPVLVPTPTVEHWMVVGRTNGLGLVLRPAPASPARVLLLQEGARVRVTGSAVQQGGHAWAPVTTSNGTSGWVASEYLAPGV
jgi:hypothetical protein